MSYRQIPYFMQNIEISRVLEDGVDFYLCKIEMFPLTVEIMCKEIIIED